MDLRGRSVLLTGATGGLGGAIARRLHAAGASLLLTGRRADVLEPLAAELGARALAVDLADRDDVARLVAEAGRVDVLVANAALPASGRLETFSGEQVDRALEVNLRAPIALTHALVPAMVARGAGHVVLMSSAAGKVGAGGTALYSATKFALRGFGQALREDLRTDGVGVSVLFPGFVLDAGMYADAGAALPRGVGTSSAAEVADAVCAAIREDRGEVDVAPLTMRAGLAVGQLLPELSRRVARMLGGERVAREMAEAQRHLR